MSGVLLARGRTPRLCEGAQAALHKQLWKGAEPGAFALLQGDKLYLKVNKLSSTKTQLPYEYYSIPYCRPEKIVSSAENLGEVLRGDRIENSPYEVFRSTPGILEVVCSVIRDLLTEACCLQIEIRVDQQCNFLCRIQSLTSSQAEAFASKIEDQYRVNM